MKKTVSAIVAFTLLVFAGAVHAELFSSNDLVETVANGEINWSKNLVRASGRGVAGNQALSEAQGRILAKRAAKVDALRNLMETVGQVRIDALTTIEKASSKSDSVSTRIKGVVKGAMIVEERVLPDGTAEVVVEAPIKGVIIDTFLGDTLGTRKVPRKGTPLNTGLVVDARGIGAKPAIAPKIVDESGKEVYGARLVNREQAIERGLAEYSRDVAEASGRERVRANPLVVKALRIANTRGNEIVISNSQAQELTDRSKNTSYLEQAKVVIVME